MAWPGDEATPARRRVVQRDAAAVAAEAWREVTVADSSAPAHAVEGLTNDETYTFQVRAVNGAGGGAPSSAAVRVGPLPVPVNLSASAGEGSMTLAWDDPGNAAIAGYQVRYGESASGLPDWSDDDDIALDGDTPRHVVQNLENGTRYTFEVRAKNPAGAGSSSGLRARPGLPPAPEDLDATVGDGVVRLEWTDADDAAITGYQIHYYRGSAPPQPVWSNIDGSHAGTTGHPVTGIADVTGYTFAVRAVNAAGDGAASSVTFEMPPPPGNLRASPGVGQVTLAWDDPHDATITGYQTHHYWESRPENPVWMVIDADDAAARRHPVQDLRNGRTYTFEVRAVNATGPGSPASVTATPVPGAPAGLEAVSQDRAVRLEWVDPADAAIDSYQVRYVESDAALPAWSENHYVEDSGSSTTDHTVAPLTNGTEYTFEVRARAGVVHGAPSAVTAEPMCPAITVEGLSDTTVTVGHDVTAIQALATGGEAPYAWSLSSTPATGAGLDIDERDGSITGTPTATGTYTVTVTVTVGQSVSVDASATGGCGKITFSMTGAPTGVGIETVTVNGEEVGRITGAAAPAGVYEVTVTATDAEGIAATGTFTITVVCPPITISQNPSPLRVQPGATETVTAIASGGCGTKTFSGPRGPDWVSRKQGTDNQYDVSPPSGTAPGTYAFSVTATDTEQNTGTGAITITVVNPPPPPLGIMCSADTTLTVGGSIKRTASAWEGVAPYTFSPLSVKPSGLSLTLSATGQDGDKGTVTGEAAPEGVYRVTVTVRDSDGASESCGFNVTVRPRPCPPIAYTGPGKVTVQAGGSTSATATASGGQPGHTFTKTDGPDWVTIADGGTITVTDAPDTPGTHTVNVGIRDANECPGTGSFEVEVTCPTIAYTGPDKVTVQAGGSTSATATASGGQPDHTFTKTDGPDWVTIADGGTITVTDAPDTPGTHTVNVGIRDANECPGTGSFKVEVACPTIAYTGPGKVTVQAGGSTSATATASGGQPDYTFTKTDGPDWVTIADGGTITVTDAPDTPGTHTVNVGIRDANECPGTGSFEVEVTCPDIVVTQSPDPVTVKAGGTATVTVSAEGGCGTKTFGNPGGLGWVRKTGSNQYTVEPPSGTAPGPYTFSVTATDAAGNTGAGTIDVTVACPDISVGGLDNVTVEVRQEIPTMTADASGGQSPYRYTMTGAPGTVEIDPTTGVVSGNVGGTDGTYLVTVKATDAGGCWGTTTFEITVVDPPLKIDAIRDVEATVGQAMPARAASASGGRTPYVFTMSGKPSWVSFNASSGRISGTPTSTGTSTATVTVTDKKGVTDTTPSFQLRVSAPLTIASISDVVVTWQLDMDPIQVSVSGGRSPYNYDLESEPAGISISSSGRISGTPTRLGSATVTVVVDDEDDRRVTTSFRMTVALPGDFNGDGRRDAADAKLFNNKMGLGRSDAGYDRRMDLNKDGTINYADFIILTGYIESDASSQSGQ